MRILYIAVKNFVLKPNTILLIILLHTELQSDVLKIRKIIHSI